MTQTQGAIGNLLNRYRAILRNCHFLNALSMITLGGLMIAGGFSPASAADMQPKGPYVYVGDTDPGIGPSPRVSWDSVWTSQKWSCCCL